jgi:hypothetical protein
VNSSQAGGFDYLGGSVCCFTPGEYIDVYQGNVSAGLYLNTYGPVDSSGKFSFPAGSSSQSLQLVKAYPLGTTYFTAVGETSGKQYNSTNVQIVVKVTLSSSTWSSGDEVQVSGFASGTGASVTVTNGTNSTAEPSLTIGSDGRGQVPLTNKPSPTGNYQVYVTIAGTNYPSPPASMTVN